MAIAVAIKDRLAFRVRTFQSTISPGIRTAVIDGDKLQTVVGVGIPMGINRQTTNNYGVLLYFSVEHQLFREHSKLVGSIRISSW